MKILINYKPTSLQAYKPTSLQAYKPTSLQAYKPNLSFCITSSKNLISKAYLLFFLVCFLSVSLTAQSYAIADSTWLTVYNTGQRYQLKNAPFGEKKPKKGIIHSMVFGADSITVKKNDDTKNFKPFTLAEIKLKVKALTPSSPHAAPPRLTAQDIEQQAQNKGKRTCELSPTDLKGKVVLVDFDPGCDPTYKCMQAQRAGATTVIVIFDTDRKDSIAMARGRYADSLRIPCFSMTRSQGDSVRMHLPSKVALFTPRVQASFLQRSDVLVFSAYKSDEKAILQWQNNTQPENSHFIVERSADGNTYERLGEVNGKALVRSLQTYMLEDDIPLEDNNFYRLILKQSDGKEIVTEPQLLNFPIVRAFDIYPNPASEEITIHLKQFDQKDFDLMLYDGIGKQLYAEHIDNNTLKKKTLNLSSLNLTEGYYTIVIIHKGRAHTRRFMFAK